MFTGNRIIKAISEAQKLFENKKINEKSLNLDMMEYVRFQEMKSLASMDGTLSLDEAMTVYGYLGNIPDTFNNQPAYVKYTLIRLFAELIKKYHPEFA